MLRALLGGLVVFMVVGCAIDRGGVGSRGSAFDGGDGPADARGLDAAAEVDSMIPRGEGGDCAVDTDPACVDGVVERCRGGVRETSPCPLGCSDTDATRCARVRASNGDIDHDATEVVVVMADVAIDTTPCTASPATALGAPLARAGGLCVLLARSVEIPAGVTVTAMGEAPLVVLAADTIEVAGVIDASARGVTPGAGGGAISEAGAASHGTNGSHASAGLADGGGAGGGMCGRGGAGGNATGNGSVSGPAGATALAADWDGRPLRGGFAGGRGCDRYQVRDAGGAGGGAVQLSAGASIHVAATGTIAVGGGGGHGGSQDQAEDRVASGAGGGSGGTVLIEAPSVVLEGTLWAPGGGGGATGIPWTNGGAGQNGVATSAARPVGAQAPVGAAGGAGGRGGGAALVDGNAGGSIVGYPYNGGGGGGGAGCIVVRDSAGAIAATGTTSPAASTSAFRVLGLLGTL